MCSLRQSLRRCVFRAAALVALPAGAGLAQADPPPGGPKLSVLPVVGSAPETGFQYGATLLRVFRRGPSETTRASSQQAYLTYTAKSQLKAFLQSDVWSEGNEWRYRIRAEYIDYPLPYYGIGDLARSDAEEWYTARGPILTTSVQRNLGPSAWLGAGFRWADTRIRDLDPSGALVAGTVSGSSGGTVSQVVVNLVLDSRDNLFSPRTGSVAIVSVLGATAALGSDYAFGRYGVEFRRYQSLRNGAVIAGQVLAEAASGSPPFDQLPSVGADTAMRGYARGRFRDRSMAAAQLEFRSPFLRRFGFVAFAGAGAVSHRAADLLQREFLPTYGVGLRYLLFPAERTSIRVDYGRGRGSSGLYVAFNEAF